MRNPVVLVDHDYRVEKIIGKAIALEIADNGIFARTKVLDTPLAKSAYALAAEGIGGWSIGFRPVDHEAIKDEKGVFKGHRFKKWELLEFSMVAIPMNQDVVNNAVARGLLTAEESDLFFRAIPMPAETAAPEPKAEVERVRVDPARVARLSRTVEAAHRSLARAEAAWRIDALLKDLT